MAIVTVGIDLTKNVFAVHGVDEFCKPVLLRPEVSRAKLLELIANLPPCLIGMEVCSGALGAKRKILGLDTTESRIQLPPHRSHLQGRAASPCPSKLSPMSSRFDAIG
jgi:transposase